MRAELSLPHGDAVAVCELLGHVGGVDALDVERDDAHLVCDVFRIAVNRHLRQLREAVERPAEKALLMLGNGVESDFPERVERGSERHDAVSLYWKKLIMRSLKSGAVSYAACP